MAGRPRTQHKRIAAIVARLDAIEDRMITFIPDQYDDTTIDNSSLPYDDLGRAWRESIEAIMHAKEQLEWLEWLLDQKAQRAGQDGAEKETAELDDTDTEDGEAEPDAQNAPTDADNGQITTAGEAYESAIS